MKYDVIWTDKASDDALMLQENEPKSYEKLSKLVDELYEHPRTGTGKPEILKGNLKGKWSRKISSKHRLVYEIRDKIVTVSIVSAYGHYDDK